MLAQRHMQGAHASDVLHTFVAPHWQIDAREHCFTAAEQHWRDGQVQFIDERGAQMLPNRSDTAAYPAGRGPRPHSAALSAPGPYETP